VRTIEAGQSVGYDATWTATHPTRLATIAIGYADGYPRALSNKGFVSLNRERAPVRGRVSMDAIIVDITEGADVKAGDAAEILGPDVPIDELAGLAGTISYEILCGFGRACWRAYGGI
jgi:alanine racemase